MAITITGGMTFSGLTLVPYVPPPSFDYLVVAGGGGGGYSNGGGGGAGGLLQATDILVTPGVTYSITTGAGGPGATGYVPNGTNGENSVISGSGFTTVTATGGGGGSSENSDTQAGSGGSGGGGNGYATTNGRLAGTGTAGPPRQGYNGGQSSGRLSGYPAGGGGGAGAVGGTPVADVSGAGGVGVQSSITGTATYYGGGGGGGGYSSTAGAGGSGGGGAGNGNGNLAPTAGTANTGGGGGGSGNGSNYRGAAGGSGVVILRFLSSLTVSATTGSPTITTDGSYNVYKFTASGSITF